MDLVAVGCGRWHFLPLVILTLAMYLSLPVHGKEPLPSYVKDMQQIVEQTNISNTEKLARLQPYLQHAESRMSALHFMVRVDKSAARDAAIALFREPTASRTEKLTLGRFLLTAVDTGDFLDEYAKFLIPAVLADEKEFVQAHEVGAYTAVGEYAYIAAGFNGYHPEHFEKMKDERVIPILIRCLNAPDDVWPKAQGDLVRGKPGTSTRRNIARQHIPTALARLGATAAIPALREIQRTHKDRYFRKSAEEALVVLTKKR